VVAAAVAAVTSLVLAWVNTRYVARRVEHLAGSGRPPAVADPRAASGPPGTVPRPGDELDAIELVVDRLSGEVSVAKAESERRTRAADDRQREYATLLSDATTTLMRQLDEIRLPLHILLENRFGDLNENQEEMLGAARAAAEAADAELRRLRQIADLDRGTLHLRREPLRPSDLVDSVLPTARFLGERRDVRVVATLAPALPRMLADPTRFREAFAILLADDVDRALPAGEVRIDGRETDGRILLSIVRTERQGGPAAGARDGEPAGEPVGAGHPDARSSVLPADLVLARRLIEAQGGVVEVDAGRTTIGMLSFTAAIGFRGVDRAPPARGQARS
jgi:signal transduction histidine kinase